jgi:hypothetical protein
LENGAVLTRLFAMTLADSAIHAVLAMVATAVGSLSSFEHTDAVFETAAPPLPPNRGRRVRCRVQRSGARMRHSRVNPSCCVLTSKLVRVEFLANASHDYRHPGAPIVVVRALTLALRGHRELVFENLARRQQLAASTERRDAASGHAIDSFWLLSREVGGTGRITSA